MADRLTQFSGGWLLLALWVGLLGLGAIMEHTPRALLPVGAVLAFVGLYLGYPLLLVFASRAIPSTPKARAFVLACCVLVCVCLTGEVFSSETVAQWFSGFGMVGVLGVRFQRRTSWSRRNDSTVCTNLAAASRRGCVSFIFRFLG